MKFRLVDWVPWPWNGFLKECNVFCGWVEPIDSPALSCFSSDLVASWCTAENGGLEQQNSPGHLDSASCISIIFVSPSIKRKISVLEREVKWNEVTQSCPTLCNPMDSSLSGSLVHGTFQARVLEWVAISFSVRKESLFIFFWNSW